VLVRAFDRHGWFADICGVRQDEIDHGLVTGVPAPSTEPDAPAGEGAAAGVARIETPERNTR
jgi:hypothetical protein